jgi:hypothetical protein
LRRQAYDAAFARAFKRSQYEEAGWLLTEPSLESVFEELKAA